MKYFAIVLLFFALSFVSFAQEEAKATPPPEAPVLADEVLYLKNGDQLTGAVVKFEDENVVFNAKPIGEVKIPWDHVKGVKSQRILYFRMENGNVIAARGLGLAQDEKQILDSPLAGRIAVSREQVLMVGLSEEGVNPEYLRTQKELKETKEALEKATQIKHLWSGYLEASFSGNEGNKNDRTFVGIGHAERKAERDKFEAHIFAKYARSGEERIANQINGYLRENVDITARLYVYGRLAGEWDEVAQIDFRFTAELGLGLHLLKEGDFQMFEGDKITLDWDIGGQYTGTDFDDPIEDSHTGGMVTRLMYNQIFPNNWKLSIMGEYRQSFQAPAQKRNADKYDDYRLVGEIRLEIPITTVFSFTGSIRDEYVNAPAPGLDRNDFYWLFGLKLTL